MAGVLSLADFSLSKNISIVVLKRQGHSWRYALQLPSLPTLVRTGRYRQEGSQR